MRSRLLLRSSLASLILLGLAPITGAGRPGRSELEAQTPVEGARGVVRGTVASRFHEETRRLPQATVQVSVDGRIRVVPTDSLGRYRIDRLPAGPVVLRASHPGHNPVELLVTVPPGRVVDVDLELAATPIPLEAVDVTGTRAAVVVPEAGNRGPPAADRNLTELAIQALDLTPGIGQEGLLDAVRNLPGNDPGDASDVLFMRGSTTDLKLVLLDGVPVYTPFHVGGLMRSFEPAVLGSADLHVGGAPARYDGGLTHILELRTRRARQDRLRASGAVDLMTATAAVESPVGAHAGLIASARSLHDLGGHVLGGKRPYGYRDLLLAFDAEPRRGHELGATAFVNSEEVLLDYARAPENARWSNAAGTVSYGRDLGEARIDASIGASAYRATLPLHSANGDDEPPHTVLATGETERIRLVTEVSWGPAEAPLRAGISHERIRAAFRAASSLDDRTNENFGRAESTGLFAEGTRSLAPGLTVRAGIRADYFPGAGVRTAPRASIMWEAGPQALVTVAAGRYHQPTRTVDPAVEHSLSQVADMGLRTEEILPVATADHVVLSLEQRLGRSVNLGLEGFFKRFEGLHVPRDRTVRSSGVDLRIVSAGDDVSGWLGYGLSWFWSGTDFSGRTADFSGRHLLTAGLAGALAGPLHGEARVSYGAGLPYTSIPIPSSVEDGVTDPTTSGGGGAPQRIEPLVSGLDEEFLRVDLELHARFEARWGGRPWLVRPYVRVLNALDRRDAMFYTFQPWRDEAIMPLAERPFLPLFGVAFSF
jgi:hypothetical protein